MAYYWTFINLLNQPISPTMENECLSHLQDGLPKPLLEHGDPHYIRTGSPVPMNDCIVDDDTKSKGTFLHFAAKKGYTALCLRMINLGFNKNYQRGRDQYTPLMIAAYYGDVDLAKMLLSNGANPDLKGNNGTALMIASNTSEASIHQALEKRGDLNKQKIINGRQEIHRILSLHNAYVPPRAASAPYHLGSIAPSAPAPSTPRHLPSLKTSQRVWNGLISFLAGLTLIYPLAKTIQYFWKQHEEKQVKKKLGTYPGDPSNALPASWCEHYTAGLTFLGYRRPPAASIPSHTTADSVHWSNPRPASS